MPERHHSDPYAVLGLSPAARQREITLAYRRLVRELHPDAAGGNSERLATVIAAYRLVRSASKVARERKAASSTAVPVRVHRVSSAVRREPDLRVGPVRYEPSPRTPR